MLWVLINKEDNVSELEDMSESKVYKVKEKKI